MSARPDTGGPAFPLFGVTRVEQEGMTLRDHFAGQALVGLLSDAKHLAGASNIANGGPVAAVVAEMAYNFADAMLRQRERAK